MSFLQVINPKLSEIANRCSGFGNNKGGRWGYGSTFKGRENAGPRTHQRFGNTTNNGINHKSNNLNKMNGFAKSNGYMNGSSKFYIL